MLGLALPYVRKTKTMRKNRGLQSLKRRLQKILQKFCELPKKNVNFPVMSQTTTHLDCQGKTEVNNFLVTFK